MVVKTTVAGMIILELARKFTAFYETEESESKGLE